MMKFKVGDKVTDRDGFYGVITRVTEWDGSRWYDIRFMDGSRIVGEAVRYDQRLITEGVTRAARGREIRKDARPHVLVITSAYLLIDLSARCCTVVFGKRTRCLASESED